MHNIQPRELLFGTVMYGYHIDQNKKKIIYSLNFEAAHRVFVKQWEMAKFTIGKSVIFLNIFFGTKNKSKPVHISPLYAGYNPLVGILRKNQAFKKMFSENSVFSFFQLQWSFIVIEKKLKTEFSINIFLKT